MKGGKANTVAVEDITESVVLDNTSREMGMVECWSADKGFEFVRRRNGEAITLFYKKSFNKHGKPYVGSAGFFVLEKETKGAAAT